MLVLLLNMSLSSSYRDTSIVLELNDLLFGEIVQEGVSLIEVFVSSLGSGQLQFELLDLLEPLGERCVLVGTDALLLRVGFFR